MFICHHGNSLAAARASHRSMTYKRRTSVAGDALRPSIKSRRLLHYRSIAHQHTMSDHSKNQLWIPGSGIRFSPGINSQPGYPSLDMSRFIHTPALSKNGQNSKIEDDYFSDDEQFEHDAAEWFDKQDELARSKSTTDTELKASEGPANAIHGRAAEGIVDLKPLEATQKQGTPIEKVQAKAVPEQNSPVVKAQLEPPTSDLDFNIPKDLFEAALKSKPGSVESYWSYSLYRSPQQDGTSKTVKVSYCKSKSTMEWVCNKYFLGEPVLGFDMEWYSYATRADGPRKNVSLIQIASPSRIGLFHVAVFAKDDFVAPTFRQIMGDEGVIKSGVNIQADCTRLKKFLGVETRGIFELSHLYKLVKHSKGGQLSLVNKRPVAMADQVQEYLRLPMYKGASVRSSNWEPVLNAKQIAYSASDAYAGLQLYHVLEGEREKLDPRPPRPHFAEKGLKIQVAIAIDAIDEDEAAPEPEPEITEEEEDSFFETMELPKGISEPSATTSDKPHAPTVVSKTTPLRSQPQAKDPRLEAAELHLQTYRSQKKLPLSAQPSALRAYYLWHSNSDLSPESAAKLLRDPPLQTNTVVSYILSSIVLEKLPYSKERLKAEVITCLAPTAFTSGRWKALIDEVQGGQTAPGTT